jgi:peptidylprolyl isomerase
MATAHTSSRLENIETCVARQSTKKKQLRNDVTLYKDLDFVSAVKCHTCKANTRLTLFLFCIANRMKFSFVVVLLLGGATLLPDPAMAFSMSMSSSSQISDRRAFLGKSVAVTAATVGLGQRLPPPAFAADDDFITTESGLKYKVIKEGNGTIPPPGATIKAHYTGWLDGFDSPRKFDSSRDRNRPFQFRVGAGQVIRGWDESFSTMSVGERRQIIIPPRLGYGKAPSLRRKDKTSF